MKTPNVELDTLVKLAAEGSLAPRDAAVVLGKMSLELERAFYAEDRQRLTGAGRRIATAEVIELLLDAVTQPDINISRLAGALRLRGTQVVAAVLKRMFAQPTEVERQPFYELVVRLSSYPELRDSVTASLRAAQGDRFHAIARQALMMVSALEWIAKRATRRAS